MRFLALFLAATATFASAAAQNSAYVDFSPMPNRLPAILFAPDPLAGALLKPLVVPQAGGDAEAVIVPAAVAIHEDPAPTVESAPATEAEAVTPDMLPPETLASDVAAASLSPGTVIAQEQPAGQSVSAPVMEITPQPGAGTETETNSQPEALSPPAPATDAVAEPPPEEPLAAPPQAAPVNGKVTVIVENVESASGSINVAVCDKDLSREGCPYVHEVPASLGFVETEFDDIPPGTYAIVGYHDVNGNNEFDKLLGMPREPYALSNNAGAKLIPTFRDASLPIKSGDNAVIIRLQRLGG